MVLTKSECELFFPTINGLIERAGVMLIKHGDLPCPDGSEGDDAITRKVLKRLWSDPATFDRVVKGWTGLTAEQRALVTSWRGAHAMHGFITFRGSQAYLLADDYAFALSGLEKPLDTMILHTPAMVEITLLPFGSKIVYDTLFMQYPIGIMPGMVKMIEDDLDRLINEGKLLTSGDELIRRMPEIKEQAAKRESESLIKEAEEALRGDEVPEGFHAGELAGLSADEREKATLTDDDAKLIRRSIEEARFDRLATVATPGKPKHALADLLELSTKDNLSYAAKLIGLKGYSKLRKRELAELIASSLADYPEIIESTIGMMPVAQIDVVHAIANEGGTLVAAREDIDGDSLMPDRKAFVCYPFYDEGKLTFVVPDEVVALAGKIDWESAKQHSRDVQQALDFTEAVVLLRGAVDLIDLAREYADHYPDALSAFDYTITVMSSVRNGGIDCELFSPNDGDGEFKESYLLAYDLAGIYRDQTGITTDDPIFDGDVRGTYLEEVLTRHNTIEPRPLPEKATSPNDLDDWILSLPAPRALTRYLDEHVPDGEPDRAFADDVMMEPITYMQVGFSSAKTINGYFDILEEHGFIPTEGMLKRLLDLLMNTANAVPQWPNNGWSANELRDRRQAEAGGPKVFYDENGKPMKIGRNDPCPCGSGKKYKKCCGR